MGTQLRPYMKSPQHIILSAEKLKAQDQKQERMTGLVTPRKQHCKSQPGTAGKKRRQNTAKPDRT